MPTQLALQQISCVSVPLLGKYLASYLSHLSNYYAESACQLCGVSVAIARLRCPNRPREPSWKYAGYDYVDAREELTELCGEMPGFHSLPAASRLRYRRAPYRLLYLNLWVQWTADLIEEMKEC